MFTSNGIADRIAVSRTRRDATPPRSTPPLAAHVRVASIRSPNRPPDAPPFLINGRHHHRFLSRSVETRSTAAIASAVIRLDPPAAASPRRSVRPNAPSASASDPHGCQHVRVRIGIDRNSTPAADMPPPPPAPLHRPPPPRHPHLRCDRRLNDRLQHRRAASRARSCFSRPIRRPRPAAGMTATTRCRPP